MEKEILLPHNLRFRGFITGWMKQRFMFADVIISIATLHLKKHMLPYGVVHSVETICTPLLYKISKVFFKFLIASSEWSIFCSERHTVTLTPFKSVYCKTTNVSIKILQICLPRGGWPGALKGRTDNAKLSVAKDLFSQTCDVDISNIDEVKRNPVWARTILKSYSRNLCTLAETKTILADVTATCNMAKQTYYDYLSGFEKLMIVEDIDAWCPAIRSKTSIRSSKKRNFIDPSIGVAAMGLSPDYFSKDYKTLGFLFESLCIRAYCDSKRSLLRS